MPLSSISQIVFFFFFVFSFERKKAEESRTNASGNRRRLSAIKKSRTEFQSDRILIRFQSDLDRRPCYLEKEATAKVPISFTRDVHLLLRLLRFVRREDGIAAYSAFCLTAELERKKCRFRQFPIPRALRRDQGQALCRKRHGYWKTRERFPLYSRFPSLRAAKSTVDSLALTGLASASSALP